MSKIEPLTLAPTDSQSENIFDQFDGASTATTPVPASTGTESPPIDSTQQQTAGKPKIVYAPHPSYPPKADKMHVTGSGRFKITFDDRGNAKSVEIVQSTGNRTLDSNTIDTLKLWRAAPGNSSYVIVPIDYRQKRQYLSNSQTMTSQHQQSRRPEPPPPPRIDFPPPPQPVYSPVALWLVFPPRLTREPLRQFQARARDSRFYSRSFCIWNCQ
jgi:TonB family protein